MPFAIAGDEESPLLVGKEVNLVAQGDSLQPGPRGEEIHKGEQLICPQPAAIKAYKVPCPVLT